MKSFKISMHIITEIMYVICLCTLVEIEHHCLSYCFVFIILFVFLFYCFLTSYLATDRFVARVLFILQDDYVTNNGKCEQYFVLHCGFKWVWLMIFNVNFTGQTFVCFKKCND